MPTMVPPPSSRSRVTLNLPVAIPLFEMQHRPVNETIRSFVDATLNARPSMPVVRTITTDFVRPVNDIKYQELQVHFHASSSIETTSTIQETTTGVVKKTFFVVMPSRWTPRTYAAAISMSLKKTSFLSVETVQINGCSYLTINDVDHYFSLSKRIYSKKLVDSSAYLDIQGGERYGELYL
jgi:hypothetical protein